MSQSPSFGDGGIASHQRQVRKTKTEKGEPQIGLCHDLGVASSLRAKRMVGICIVKRKNCFQKRSG